MRAAFIRRLGAPDVIELGELPDPTPGPTDVLVSVETVAANPVDTFVRSGRYPTATPFPFVVGRDLVGTVVDAGPGASFRIGERVWCNSLGHDGRQGSFAQLAVVPAERCYRVPDRADPHQLVASAHPGATAYLGLVVHAQLRPGETVYVGGAEGNVGSAAVAIGAHAGARVIAGVRRGVEADPTPSGADSVVDFGTELAAQLHAVAPHGVDVFWDTSGHHDFDVVGDVVAPGARVLLTAAATPRPPLPEATLYTRDVRLLGFVISRARVDDLAAAAPVVGNLVADGELTARISDVLPLDATRDVHAGLESGEVGGRVLLQP